MLPSSRAPSITQLNVETMASAQAMPPLLTAVINSEHIAVDDNRVSWVHGGLTGTWH